MADLRRGFPVYVTGGSALWRVAAAEYGLSALAGPAPQFLLLAAARAKRLGLKVVDKAEVVRIALAPGLTDEAIQRLVDPCHREGALPPLTLAAAETEDAMLLHLAKIGELLPAMLVTRADKAPEPHLLTVSVEAIAGYEHSLALSVRRVSEAAVPLKDVSDARVVTFRPITGGYEHLAIIVGQPEKVDAPAVRVHSSCITGDVLGSLRCDCGDQLRGALRAIAEAGAGVVVYLNQEGRGIGIANKMRAYVLQDGGLDTFAANEEIGYDADERGFLIAAQILKELGLTRIRLMTNNPNKISGLTTHGITVVDRVPLIITPTETTEFYLHTKAKKGGHLF